MIFLIILTTLIASIILSGILVLASLVTELDNATKRLNKVCDQLQEKAKSNLKSHEENFNQV